MQQEVGCNSDADFWGKCSKKRKCTSCCAMSGRPIMIRRVGIAWLVSPWQDLHPHDAGEDRCGQKTKCARSKIGQTRCLPLWISDSPFRIIDGGSCSISLVVNQSVGGIFNPHSLTQDPFPLSDWADAVCISSTRNLKICFVWERATCHRSKTEWFVFHLIQGCHNLYHLI